MATLYIAYWEIAITNILFILNKLCLLVEVKIFYVEINLDKEYPDEIYPVTNSIIASETKYREYFSTCIYGNRRQRIHSLTIVVETPGEEQFYYIYVLNTSLK